MLKFLSQLTLVTLLLLQSVAGLADMHRFHQADGQHQVVDTHDHGDTTLTDFVDSTDAQGDCQHCCHCHSSACSALPVSVLQLGLFGSVANISPYRLKSLTDVPKSLYRPPIA